MLKVPPNAGWNEIAHAACTLHMEPGDARQAVEDWVARNPAHYQRLAAEVLPAFVEALVRDTRHARARKAVRGTTCPKGQETVGKRSRAAALDVGAAVGRAISIYAWPMCGKVLGECTRDDLLRGAAQNRLQASGNLRIAIFQETVAGKLRGGKIVREAIAENTLMEINQDAQTQADAMLGLAR